MTTRLVPKTSATHRVVKSLYDVHVLNITSSTTCFKNRTDGKLKKKGVHSLDFHLALLQLNPP